MELTKEDLTILIDAVEVWEHKDQSSALLASTLGMMLSKNKEEAKSHIEQAIKRGNDAHNNKKEIATCLKARLILMKNRIEESLVIVETQHNNNLTKEI